MRVALNRDLTGMGRCNAGAEHEEEDDDGGGVG
jgi:hypothetical protein